jgi:hypothetical protein
MFLGDLWNERFTDRGEIEAIIGPPFETLMVRDGETDPWRMAGPNDSGEPRYGGVREARA